MQVITDELIEMRDQYGDQRRSEILQSRLDLTLEDLITEEDVVVTLSHAGYAKAQPVDTYRAQKRGKGKPQPRPRMRILSTNYSLPVRMIRSSASPAVAASTG